MHEYYYNVVIRKTGTGKNTRVTGELNYTFSEYDTDCPFPRENIISLEFEPLIILGDLRNKEQSCEYIEERFNIDRSWQCLLGSYEYEYGFGEPLYIGNDEQYLKFVSKLDKIMRNNECTNIKDLKKIQIEHKLNLECNIFLEVPNIWYDLLQRKKDLQQKKYINY